MKTVLIAYCLMFSLLFPSEKKQEKFSLTVEITGIKEDGGTIYLAIYNNKKDFLKKGIGGNVVVKNKKASYTFKNLKKGEYAVSLFHDENDNDKIDKSFIGIPKEPYGFSNDVKGFMGPPSFEDTKIKLDENKNIKIKLH